ncbi:MAG TPA: recombinase RecA, partial [Candidatus Paceibacterota bacterium]|nr:recombinase RecA [Candidatus Paceibacterota bacterium]
KEIQEKFGEGSIMQLGQKEVIVAEAIPTGSLSLDLALGVGGVPKGRIIEIYGAESSGKTTLALHIIAQAQKKGGKAAFIDSEHALDPEYAKRIGVNLDNLLISQPDSGEQALDIAEALVRSGQLDVIVIDSVAALTPQAEIEGEMGDQQIGLQARLMSRALRKLTAFISKTKTVLIFINQTRMQIRGMAYGNPVTTPGGKALKFFSSVRVELNRIAQIKKGEEIVGSRIKAKVVKNKVAPPFKIAEFDIYYSEGISLESDLINIGLKRGLIQKSGNTFYYKDKKLGSSLDSARLFLKENKPVAEEIYNNIISKKENDEANN